MGTYSIPRINKARRFLQVLVDGTPPPHTLKDEHSLHPTLSWAYQRVLLPLFETHIVPSLFDLSAPLSER